MNEKQQELLDEAYENYLNNFIEPICPPNLDVQPDYYEPMNKEFFIKSAKEKGLRGEEFSRNWGLTIEERELSLEERNYSLSPGQAYLGIFGYSEKDDLEYKELFDKEGRPTKLITVTYNDTIIESYEN